MEWSDRIGRRLKLRDLHILLAVVQYGSISKAADHLAISHPVVSKAIADLEQTLGASPRPKPKGHRTDDVRPRVPRQQPCGLR
jgi:hypothetical protein